MNAPRGPLWLHGASLGDVRALAPTIDALDGMGPICVTAHRRTARSWARANLPVDAVRRPPVPVWPLTDLWVARTRPRALVLEYLELWPAWVAACARRGVPVVVIDGRIGPRTLRAARWLRPTARRLAAFAAQSEADAAAARALGVAADRVFVHGSGKHDRAMRPVEQPSAALAQRVGPVDVVVGSLAEDEEADVLAALARAGLRALIAPRHLDRVPALLRRAQALGVDAALRSRPPRPNECARWVVLDTHGELAEAWALGRVALVGGTFGDREGQNLLEPALHGRPIIHGPHVANVRVEAAALAGPGLTRCTSVAEAFDAVRTALLGGAHTVDYGPRIAALLGAATRNGALIRRVLTNFDTRC